MSFFSWAQSVIVGLSGNVLQVDENGRALVSVQPAAPGPGETEFSIINIGSSPGTTDVAQTITSGKTLKLQSFSFSCESSTNGARFTVYEDPNGTLSPLNTILEADVIENGSNDQRGLSASFVGDGTRRIVLRVEQLSGGSNEFISFVKGVEV